MRKMRTRLLQRVDANGTDRSNMPIGRNLQSQNGQWGCSSIVIAASRKSREGGGVLVRKKNRPVEKIAAKDEGIRRRENSVNPSSRNHERVTGLNKNKQMNRLPNQQERVELRIIVKLGHKSFISSQMRFQFQQKTA